MTEYPYMYARISAKRAKLFDRQDYENFLKMQPNQIAKNLGEGAYREEIDELGARYDGVELVELALNRNLSNTMTHLCKIAPESLETVIKTYLRKYDIMSLKRLLRWKRGGERGNIEDILVPMGSFSMEELEQLSEKSFEEIRDQVCFPGSEINYQDRIKEAETLSDIERALDVAYHEELELLATEVDSPMFKRFIEDELEHEDIRTALRLKKYDFSEAEIREYLSDGRISGLVEEIISSDDIEDAMEAVVSSSRTGGVDEDRLEDLEHALEVERLQKSLRMLHTEPLGITSILGYIIAKIIEVKNLRMMIRAKETGIQNRETIRKNLVMA